MALNVYNKDVVEMMALSLLRQGEMYAYDIMKQISALSGETVTVQGGTLYPILYKLAEKGLVTDRVETVGKRNRMTRVYYTITPLGQEHLDDLIRENDTVQTAVRRVFRAVEGSDVK